ncbi:MAG: hypothetical protein LC790_03535 [Actinobacteria bacterium]|nr:hypothetical protein [Actinomycetota bacterium]MCA1698008.1 hypothetical protein [Actinomycetota bacterium]
MRLHRFEATAQIEPGQTEARIDRSAIQLVTVALTDAGPVLDGEGREHTEPDVVCHLRPGEARELAFSLLSLAEHADRLSDEECPR